MVGLVIVSHSAPLAEGVRELAGQMTGGRVPLAVAGGIDDPENPIGTDPMRVLEAIDAVYSDDGVVVLMDLGSALLSAETRARLLAAALVVLLTAITLRGAHFLGGVPWTDQLWRSALAQAALSIVWTVAGIAAMLLGKQRGSRAVWLGGAVLMGVVIAKLLLIDREHLHDLAAIVGVLVVGVLLVAVGYFAPAPPRTSGENA